MKVEMTDVFFITRTIFSRASSSRPAVRAAPRTRAFPGTMASEISRELAPLVKRADEIQAHHPLMAYYCACPSSRDEASCQQPDDARRVSSLRRFSNPRPTHR